jgi:hypothetical protein
MVELDGLPLALANGIGVVGVVLIVGWLVWTGRLVPRATHDAHVTLLNERLDDEQHEKAEWRTESRIKDQQIQELNEQNQMLRAFGTTLNDFLQGLRRAGIGDRRGVDES